MALTAASALHYWSSRFESVPVVGGKPVHSRNSIASWIDQNGIVQQAPVNTPRFEWATIAGERRKVMRLEQSRTNSVLWSRDFSNAAWTKTTLTVTTALPDPAGGTSACTLTATGALGTAEQNLGAGASLSRMASLWIRRRTGTGAILLLWPSAVDYETVVPTAIWQRFATIGTTANTARLGRILVYTSGDEIDVWNYQIDDAATTSADIPTTSAAVTRSADSFYWNFTPVPQAMMAYAHFVERGTIAAAKWLWSITDAARASPLFRVLESGGKYTVYHHNGSSASTASLAAAPVYGNVVELVAILYSDGHVRIIQSINGAAVSSAVDATTAALASAWVADRVLYVNGGGTDVFGLSDWAELKLAKYADVVASSDQGIMDELRAFELNQAGEVI